MSLQEPKARIIEDAQAVNDEKALQEVLDMLRRYPFIRALSLMN